MHFTFNNLFNLLIGMYLHNKNGKRINTKILFILMNNKQNY